MMKRKLLATISLVGIAALAVGISFADPMPLNHGHETPERIVWYGVLNDGIAVAKTTNRPILLLSAAPQCAGVPGMW